MSALPEWVDPRRLAVSDGRLDGEIAVGALARLAAELYPYETAGAVRLDLQFAEDDQRRITVTGHVRAQLRLQCQRCLGPAEWSADAAVKAMVVDDDEAAAAVPREWEPVIAEPRGLAPAALAEDELLLAMPTVARCGDPACRDQYEVSYTHGSGGARTDNPFSVLGDLKRGR